MQSKTIRIGTRGSPLALWQAGETRRLLVQSGAADEDAVEIVVIRTTGDRITEGPLTEAGGKGLFTKEIDEALLAGAIDIAVHSAKDMPTELPAGIVIAACLEREDVRDAFLSPVADALASLPRGARLGTSSLRRKAMALSLRPDLSVVEMRGNVDTRVRKVAEGKADATLLAVAGLKRLGLLDRATSLLDVHDWLPAVGQGAIAIAARGDDAATLGLLTAIDHRPTSIALCAERAFLAVLDGSCRTPIAGLANLAGDRLTFAGSIIKPDGSVTHRVSREGLAADAEAIGRDAAAELLHRGGLDFFAP